MLPFTWVDVFTEQRYAGNQLCVFRPAQPAPFQLMQQVTREMNHSETVFLEPPADSGAHCRVRIFIPTLPDAVEIPFAGHPLLGAACVWAGDQPGEVRLETGAGLITVDVHPLADGVWDARMGQPLPRTVRTFERDQRLADALGLPLEAVRADLPVEAVDNGMQTVLVPLASVDAVQRAAPDAAALRALFGRHGFCTMLLAVGSVEAGADVHVRVFSPYDLVWEDPATGSANGPMGEYLVRHGVLPGPVVRSEQGYSVGRPSRLTVEVERREGATTAVRVGGRVVLVGDGRFRYVQDQIRSEIPGRSLSGES